MARKMERLPNELTGMAKQIPNTGCWKENVFFAGVKGIGVGRLAKEGIVQLASSTQGKK